MEYVNITQVPDAQREDGSSGVKNKWKDSYYPANLVSFTLLARQMGGEYQPEVVNAPCRCVIS